MIVSARVFLILLAPLLLHGAPASSPPPPWRVLPPPIENHPGPSIPPGLRSPGEGQEPDNKLPLIRGHADQPLHQPLPSVREVMSSSISRSQPHIGTNPVKPTYANQPLLHQPPLKYTPVSDSLRHAIPEEYIIKYIDETYSEFPTGTLFKPKPGISNVQLNTIPPSIGVTEAGDLIFVPEGIKIHFVAPPKYISLPRNRAGEFRLLSEEDPEAQTIAVFSEDSIYANKNRPRLTFTLKTVVDTRKDRIVTTPDGHKYYVEAGSSILVSKIPGRIFVPTGPGTKIRLGSAVFNLA